MADRRRLRLLAAAVWHSRWSQLQGRLLLTLRRQARARLARRGLPPGRWYLAEAPAVRERPTVIDAVLPAPAPTVRLPLAVDLVGTPWTVALGMDWNPAALDRGTHLEKLNLHYMEYLHALVPADGGRLMADWAQRVPPFLPGYWKDTWNSYALSIRVVGWMEYLTRHAAVLPAALLPVVHQSLGAQLRFLRRNLETDIGGNHLMKNLRALLRAGTVFEGPEVSSWVRTACLRLQRELREQVLPDGMHFELSPAYHLQVLEDLIDMRRCIAACDGSDPVIGATQRELDEALTRMAAVARRFRHPDGMPALFADGGLHMAAPTAALLGALAAIAPQTRAAAPDSDGAWRLADAGYFGLRHGRSLFVVDCGPVGAGHLPAHGHGDALSIEWTVEGRRVVVDAGVLEYHAGPARAYSRSTAAHNTVTVSDADQSEFWSAFRVGRRAHARCLEWVPAPDGFVFAGEHDGFTVLPGAPVHRRRISAEPTAIHVVDEVRGGAGQPVAARLLLAPDARIIPLEAPASGHALLIRYAPADDEPGLAIELSSTVPLRVESARWHPDFGCTVATQRIVLDGGAAPCRFEWGMRVRAGEAAAR